MWGHVESRLLDYVSGTLPPPEADRVARHLETCARCREACQAVRFSASLLTALPPAAAPPTLWQAIESALPASRPATPSLMPVFRWTAIAAMLAVGALGFTRPVPVPEPASGVCGAPGGKSRYRCEMGRVSWPARDDRAAVVPSVATHLAECRHCHRP